MSSQLLCIETRQFRIVLDIHTENHTISTHQNDVTVIEYINRDKWLDCTITYSLYIKRCHTHTHTHMLLLHNVVSQWPITSHYRVYTLTLLILLCSWEVKLLDKLWTNMRPLRAVSNYYRTGCSAVLMHTYVYTEELT